MNVFSVIENALALVRLPKGVFKEVKVYARKTLVYIPHGSGFVQIRGEIKPGEFSTSHPDVKIVELDLPTCHYEKRLGAKEPRYTGNEHE